MYRRIFIIVLGILWFISASAQETWNIDNGHSNINFEVGWEGFSVRTGEFKVFEGNLTTVINSDLTTATWYLKVDPASIDVIAPNLSEQLKGERFLDAAKFPEITFHSAGAKAISDSIYITSGKLNIHGIERDQEAMIHFKGQKKGTRSYLMALEVTLKLNRTDFGLTWGSPRLGETVKVIGHLLYQRRIEEQ